MWYRITVKSAGLVREIEEDGKPFFLQGGKFLPEFPNPFHKLRSPRGLPNLS